MTVNLRPDWMNERLTTRPYPIGAKVKESVDELFDKLHEQGKMSWSTKATPFGFLVFVISAMLLDFIERGGIPGIYDHASCVIHNIGSWPTFEYLPVYLITLPA